VLSKPAFHDADTDIIADILARIVAKCRRVDVQLATGITSGNRARVGRKDVGVSGEWESVSVSASWNAAFYYIIAKLDKIIIALHICTQEIQPGLDILRRV